MFHNYDRQVCYILHNWVADQWINKNKISLVSIYYFFILIV